MQQEEEEEQTRTVSALRAGSGELGGVGVLAALAKRSMRVSNPSCSDCKTEPWSIELFSSSSVLELEGASWGDRHERRRPAMTANNRAMRALVQNNPSTTDAQTKLYKQRHLLHPSKLIHTRRRLHTHESLADLHCPCKASVCRNPPRFL
ncbi:uncharacterized protein MONBRDRAFT_4920 [Monosiga brevicollis MX1]|uniref:Uncharacterized protein n=1 Tax=Monosiga brevicollis TaxID=81824 RepID=A9UPC5_MONBE|nr:uncharacterized protein MONBRDRAFT_4920 [Monosiga brevicollis MX1]EDQ92393.1 predicted protein [Monosiga brevicollis MX1]|eukprot:XP_001742155.1 hypothetical protein [Monosiga brevicollis MX1]